MVNITFPDGTKKQFNSGVTGLDVAKSIGARLARDAVAVKVNNELYDLNRPITADSTITILTFDSKEGKDVFWHSTAHLLAQAVLELWSDTKLTIGPTIENGFYYDFDKKTPFTPEDLEKLEKKMYELVKKDIVITRKEIPITEAKKLYKNNKYKLELLDEFKEYGENKVTVYHQGEFYDMCRGPHITSTGKLTAFKLTKISSAYWRGDQKRESLQRIYGISFPEKKQLDAYLKQLEEAEKRDHRKLGSELDLLYFHEFSPGAAFFLEKGAVIFNELVNFIRAEYRKRGYKEVITPQLYNKKLWEISGHWEHYKESMFVINVEGEEHSLKPMNCPSHCLIYARDFKSYKELPVKIADFCNLHRNELSGTLSGLFRVRKFAQDDAHIFCTLEQIENEVMQVLDFIDYVWTKVFNFKLEYFLATMPEKALGTKEIWDKAEKLLKNALEKKKIKYTLNAGDGAFYGPKIDMQIEDSLGRKWQCPTCQLDFNLPQRFKLEYEGSDGKRYTPVMLHRAVLGSLERFIGVLIEHYAGKFPLWLNPNQVAVLPIADRHMDYCKKVAQKMFDAGLRVYVNESSETTNKKIREAQLQQYNYLLVVGDLEVKNETVNVRTRDEKVHGEKKVSEFIKQLQKEIEEKK